MGKRALRIPKTAIAAGSVSQETPINQLGLEQLEQALCAARAEWEQCINEQIAVSNLLDYADRTASVALRKYKRAYGAYLLAANMNGRTA